MSRILSQSAMRIAGSFQLLGRSLAQTPMRPGTRPTILQSRGQARVLPVILSIALASESYYLWSLREQKEPDALFSLPVPPGVPQPSLFNKNPAKALTLDEAEAKLISGQGQGSFAGVSFHTFRLGSNDPVEDQYAYSSSPSIDGKQWHYWGVYDGHAGWATSSLLKDTLIPVVAKSLQKKGTDDIKTTIRNAFLDLDRHILDNAATFLAERPKNRTEGIAAMAPATAGSCALLAMFDPANLMLRVANVGDSRAVLGRYDETSGKYTTIPLSVDQTGFNAEEVARLAAEHPGEDGIIDPKSGRLLGIAITRAFGDHRWKWDTGLIERARRRYRGSSTRPLTQTPPYMTAEPEITETQIQKGGRGDFVIMASDGLWDNISSEDAVECVSRWLNTPAHRRKAKPDMTGNDPEWDGKSASFRATPEFFVVENENAATHLAKNAFGGSRRDLFRYVMSAYPPVSRSVRDDLTIQVIFFADKV